jgi:predicted nucleotidyltransferase
MNQELKINKEEFDIFLEVAKELNKNDITPVLFGSLGLMRIIGEFKKAADIDILIEENLLEDKWLDLVGIMKKIGFKLIDKKEHEFSRRNKIVGFARIQDLLNVDVDYNNLKLSEVRGRKFKELSVNDYLICYKRMLRDHYRQEKRGKDDKEKIRLIEEFMK